MVESAKVRLGLESQLSEAVGLLKLGVAVHSMVLGPPTPLMVGLVVSLTVIVWVQLAVLPLESVAL